MSLLNYLLELKFMKIFIWLLVFACTVWSVCCWGVSKIVAIVIAGMAPDLAWPGITTLMLHSNGWILLFSLPWFVYAVILSRRNALTPNMAFLFAGTVGLALSILTCAVAIACMLPFGEIYFRLEPKM